MAHAVLLTALVRTTLRAQPRYRAILAQGGPRRRRTLERLVDEMKRLPRRRARTTRELARLVWLKEKGESPWPAMKRSSIAIVDPSCPADHPDRGLQCQLALEPAFDELAERAAESGWTEDEIGCALLELAGARLKSNSANRETERAIDRARATR